MLYEVCGRVSDSVGFRFRDHREACYLMLYLVAALSQFLLDFVMQYYSSTKIMEGLHFRTYTGELLKDIGNYQEHFETYAMQRNLAENVFLYAWPSTFLLPFLAEPFVSYWMPLLVGKLIMRSHP